MSKHCLHRRAFLFAGRSLPSENALEIKGRYELYGQELKIKNYIGLA